MKNYGKAKAFELNLRVSPKEASELITKSSDEMSVKGKDSWRFWIVGYSGHGPFQHQNNGTAIFIQKRPNLKNSQHGVNVQVEPTSFGCRLVGARTLNPLAKGFMHLWFGLLGLVSVVTAISLAQEVLSDEKPSSELLWILVPIGMVIFGCFWILFGRLLAKPELLEIEEWLNTLFADAKLEGKMGAEA